VNLRDYLPVLVFFAIGLVAGGSILLLSRLVGRRKPNPVTAMRRSARTGTARSAAAVGVGARKSAT